MVAVAQYQYGKSFQIAVLSVLVSDSIFARSNLDAISPTYFESMELAALSRIIIDHYKVHPTEPITMDGFRSGVIDYCITHRLQEDREKIIMTTLDEVLYTSISDPETVKQRIVNFGQRQALKRAISESIEILEKNEDYGNVRTLIDKALMVGMKTDNTIDFSDVAERLPEHYKARQGIRTLIGPLDRALLSGGIAPGEFAVVGAPPKYGKSTFLVNMGAAALVQDKKVLHVSYEGGLREVDVAMKYACRLTGYTATEIAKANPGYFDALRYKKPPFNKLVIGWFAPGTQTVVELRSYINHMIHMRGFHPDVLILDYPDKMKYIGSDYLQGMSRMYDQITELLNDFGMVGWGGSQGGRGAYREEETTAANIEGTWMKVANADVVMMMSQTKTEREHKKFRLGLEAVRRGEGGFQIPLHIDYGRSWVCFESDWYPDKPTEKPQVLGTNPIVIDVPKIVQPIQSHTIIIPEQKQMPNIILPVHQPPQGT